jgi:3-oxoacyl-[acyl-carrier protein] reductase
VQTTGSRVLVTGAAAGIGAAIARRLGADGWLVAASAEVPPLDTVTALGERGKGSCVDLAQPGAGTALVQWAHEAWGGLDAVVNCAGLTLETPVGEASDDDVERMLAVNLRAPWDVVAAAATALSPGGAVVNVSSVHAGRTHAGRGVYAATKGAIEAMTRQLAVELAPRGIRVNAVAPGLIRTERIAAMPGYSDDELRPYIPAARAGTPEEVAAVVAFLLSEEASYVHGAVVLVDGGLSAQLNLP